MICQLPVSIRSFDRSVHGLRTVTSVGDGYTVAVEWNKSFAIPSTWTLVYNIYYSSVKNDIFNDGVKAVIPGNDTFFVNITDNFKPGDMYYFAVRAAAHEPGTLQLAELPYDDVSGFYIYPEASLREDITADSLIIPLDDVSQFPSSGIVLINAELIGYSSVDLVNNNLILSDISQRGMYNYEPRIHTVDGYDGVRYYEDFVQLWKGWEEQNTATGVVENRFKFDYARTNADGYRERVDILTGNSNLNVVNVANDGFPYYDQTGWDRTHLADYLSGKCVGTYFGGEYGCADGYEAGGSVRGLSIQDHMNMREEYLLELTGEPVVLFRRQWEGIQSRDYSPHREQPAYRSLDSYGTSLITGYEQYYNSRRSDGKILVRFGPTKEDLKREESGIENVFIPNCWTIVTPSVKDGDFIIRFNQDGSEEWRYEIIDVERNKVLLEESGAQKFTAVRVRKTDPICQVRSFRDTSMYPSEILTSIGMLLGPNESMIPHTHRIVISENITDVSQINQETSVERGHSHSVVNGVISESLGHSHEIIL